MTNLIVIHRAEKAINATSLEPEIRVDLTLNPWEVSSDHVDPDAVSSLIGASLWDALTAYFLQLEKKDD